MKVTPKDIEIVASLSRLKISSEETPEILQQLDKFLAYVENLQSIDTTEVLPTTYALPVQNVFREDRIKKSLERELALLNAPQKEDGYFKVPRVLEE